MDLNLQGHLLYIFTASILQCHNGLIYVSYKTIKWSVYLQDSHKVAMQNKILLRSGYTLLCTDPPGKHTDGTYCIPADINVRDIIANLPWQPSCYLIQLGSIIL